jgi:hypothetical protein
MTAPAEAKIDGSRDFREVAASAHLGPSKIPEFVRTPCGASGSRRRAARILEARRRRASEIRHPADPDGPPRYSSPNLFADQGRMYAELRSNRVRLPLIGE